MNPGILLVHVLVKILFSPFDIGFSVSSCSSCYLHLQHTRCLTLATELMLNSYAHKCEQDADPLLSN